MNLKQAAHIIGIKIGAGKFNNSKIVFEIGLSHQISYYTGTLLPHVEENQIILEGENFESFEEALIELAKDLSGVK